MLVVEDDRVAAAIYRQALELDGFAVSCAADGREALAMIEAERPDLVLLDLLMPVMDGWQFLRELRSIPEAPPVVVASATGDAPEALRAGASAFFGKPCSLAVLREACVEIVSRTAAPD